MRSVLSFVMDAFLPPEMPSVNAPASSWLAFISTPAMAAITTAIVSMTLLKVFTSKPKAKSREARTQSGTKEQYVRGRCGASSGTSLLQGNDMELKKGQIKSSITNYESYFDGARVAVGTTSTSESIATRKKEYAAMVNLYYDLATDFYEYGWGQSFHFAPRFRDEAFMESIKRVEYFIAARLGLSRGDRCLDLGCGVGGPMRNIARFSGAKVFGVNNSQYQINVGRKETAELHLDGQCFHIKGDFMQLPDTEELRDGSFDAAYGFVSICIIISFY